MLRRPTVLKNTTGLYSPHRRSEVHGGMQLELARVSGGLDCICFSD